MFGIRTRSNTPERATPRRLRARVLGRTLELAEALDLPDDTEVTIAVEALAHRPFDVVQALRQSAGVWSDAGHPELRSREDATHAVRDLRHAFHRGYGA